MQLVLDTNGLKLTKRNRSFYVQHKSKGRRMISPHRITSIAVVADCLISTAALRLAGKHSIPVHFCQRNGRAEASVYSTGYGSIATLRRRQILMADTENATALIVQLFGWKTAGQIEHLRSLADKTKETESYLSQQYQKMRKLLPGRLDDLRSSLLGLEGSSGRAYWQTMGRVVPANWMFTGRSRQPARDAFNSMLNYCYGITYNVVEGAIHNAGLDPFLGFFHTDEYQRPTLTYDLIEPFRPWVDQFITELTAQHPLPAQTWFTTSGEGIWLSKRGRKFVVPQYNDFLAERLTWRSYTTNRRNHIYRFIRQFAQAIRNGEHLSGQL